MSKIKLGHNQDRDFQQKQKMSATKCANHLVIWAIKCSVFIPQKRKIWTVVVKRLIFSAIEKQKQAFRAENRIQDNLIPAKKN